MNLADIFKALGDETRLEIVKMLIGRELCVCDILESVDKSQPVVSHHLKVLRLTTLVTDRREGKWVYYKLNPLVLEHLEYFMASARKDTVMPRKCD